MHGRSAHHQNLHISLIHRIHSHHTSLSLRSRQTESMKFFLLVCQNQCQFFSLRYDFEDSSSIVARTYHGKRFFRFIFYHTSRSNRSSILIRHHKCHPTLQSSHQISAFWIETHIESLCFSSLSILCLQSILILIPIPFR